MVDSSLLKSKSQVYCLGFNHRSSPLDLREKLYLTEKQIAEVLPEIKKHFPISELLMLSTCNRIEFFAVVQDVLNPWQVVQEAFISAQNKTRKDAPLQFTEVQEHCFRLEEVHAWRHLFNIVSSLDSVVVGETQITGQFKRALQIAHDQQLIGPMLGQLSQDALEVGKKIRSQTEIGRKTVSVSHAAIDLAKKVFGELSDRKFLIIGAGEMALIAAQYAATYSPQKLVVANRSLDRAQSLVDQIGRGTALPLNQLDEAMHAADIIISSTSSPHAIISKDQLKKIMAQRPDRPLFICDIAIPRDVEPSCCTLEEVYLFEVDDLQKVVDENKLARLNERQKANEYIEDQLTGFAVWLKNLSIKPMIADFKKYVEQLCQQEVNKSTRRDNLSSQQLNGLEKMVQSIAQKIAGDAAQAIKHSPMEHQLELAKALELLFPKQKPRPSDSFADLERGDVEATKIESNLCKQTIHLLPNPQPKKLS